MSRRPAVRAALPLAVWAGLLTAAAVLITAVVPALWLHLTGGLGPRAGQALTAGVVAGLVVSLSAVLAAARLAAALRGLPSDAVRRLHEPSGPIGRPGPRSVLARVSTELAELARALDGLHLRVRVADEVGERHRLDAEMVGVGVFELLSGLVEAEEGARGQLAAELHDTVAQSLMIARSLLAAQPDTAGDLARLSDYVQDAEEQVRAVMARTRPPALREGDLASAVCGLRDDLRNRYGLEVSVRWPDAAHPLPLASAVTVYRFFQEALFNIVKHADVEAAELSLELTDDALLATVRDAGPGFDPSEVQPDRGRHVGLGLLRERARLSGGRLEVRSEHGLGAELVLRLPRSAQVAPGRGRAVDDPVVPPRHSDVGSAARGRADLRLS